MYIQRILIVFLLLILQCGQSQGQIIKDLKATVILISFDGFHPSYLNKIKDGYISTLSNEGVRAKGMIPVYPSKTYPNHYSIVTGLYSEHHGIVHNTIYDPVFKSVFSLANRQEVHNSRWWQGEPIWITAKKNGLRTASYFFPGTETKIDGIQPAHWKIYDSTTPNQVRVDSILSWLDLPQQKRPQFLSLYFSDQDDAGHSYGPQSAQIDSALRKIDNLIGLLIGGLKERAIYDNINLLLVSDHGMARVDPGHYIVLDDYFDSSNAEIIVWDQQLTGIFPKPGMEESIYKELQSNYPGHLKVFKKNETPQQWHYRENRRIAPIICQADEGWWIIQKDEYNKKKLQGTLSKTVTGAHGYDNRLPSMQGIFLARGPAFKKHQVIEPFENIQLYNLMTRILNIPPAPNEGSMKWAETVLK